MGEEEMEEMRRQHKARNKGCIYYSDKRWKGGDEKEEEDEEGRIDDKWPLRDYWREG